MCDWDVCVDECHHPRFCFCLKMRVHYGWLGRLGLAVNTREEEGGENKGTRIKDFRDDNYLSL